MGLLKESSNSGKKGVVGIIILKSDKMSPLITTFDKKTTKQYTEYINELVKYANLFCIHGSNDVQLIRLHYNGRIVLVAPDKNFTFLAVQETKF
ncbi:Dynein light chain roadblock-type 2 [Cryptosporidium felis]|nr:Dynein light chain roadblock-type 2 [Cryptosporidium felis]